MTWNNELRFRPVIAKRRALVAVLRQQGLTWAQVAERVNKRAPAHARLASPQHARIDWLRGQGA
jgi:hypothetical protein